MNNGKSLYITKTNTITNICIQQILFEETQKHEVQHSELTSANSRYRNDK